VTSRGGWAHAVGTIAVLAWCHVGWAPELDPSSVLVDLYAMAELVEPFPHRILRLDLDVTGDGRTELLLAEAARNAQMWQVCEWVSETKVKRLGEVPFAYWRFLLTPDPVTLVGTYALSETDPDGFATYRIDASGVQRLSLKAMDEPGVPDYDFEAWRKAVGLKVAFRDLSARPVEVPGARLESR
jgi:hypothetical protein